MNENDKYIAKAAINFVMFESVFWTFGSRILFIFQQILFYRNFEYINELYEIMIFVICIPLSFLAIFFFMQFLKNMMKFLVNNPTINRGE